MKKNIKLFFIIFLILLLVVAIASFSWFANVDNVEFESEKNISIQVGKNLEISLHGSDDWSGLLSLTNNVSLIDCSGDGKTFFAPAALKENDEPADDSMKEIGKEELSNYVFDTYIDVKADTPLDFYLASRSYITPKPNKDAEDTSMNSLHGDYLAGYLSGSVRVAFFEVAENGVIGEPICIWSPNSKVEYDKTNNKVTDPGQRESENVYYKSEKDKNTYSADDYAEGKFLLAEGTTLCTADSYTEQSRINHSPKLLSFTSEDFPEGDKEAVKTLLIRVWFEGTDREAHSVFNSGKVNYNFSFAGVNPKGAQKAEDIEALNKLTWAGSGNECGISNVENGKFIYSQNGIDWAPLTNGKFTEAEAKAGIYIALDETADSTVGKTLGTDMVFLKKS